MISYLEEITALQLPIGSYAIFGSGPLAVRNLRDNTDIDLIVTKQLWRQLSTTHEIATRSVGDRIVEIIEIGNIELFHDWLPYVANVEPLIASAELINGFPYVRLEHVLAWKRMMGRPKDIVDMQKITAYLNNQH